MNEKNKTKFIESIIEENSTEEEIKNTLHKFLKESKIRWIYLSGLYGKRKLYVVYTAGLNLIKLPELLVMGPNLEACYYLLEFYALMQFAQGESNEHGFRFTHIVCPCSIVILNIGDNAKRHFMKKLKCFYGNWNFYAQQLLIPDDTGKFVWEDGCNEKWRQYQFVLSK